MGFSRRNLQMHYGTGGWLARQAQPIKRAR